MNGRKDSIPAAPGQPGFDAAVRVARRTLAERIAANTRDEQPSTGDRTVNGVADSQLPSTAS